MYQNYQNQPLNLISQVLFACSLISLAGVVPVLFFTKKLGHASKIDEQILKESYFLKCLMHFSVGTLLFDSICHILPEAYELVGRSKIDVVLFRTLIGIILFFMIERLGGLEREPDETENRPKQEQNQQNITETSSSPSEDLVSNLGSSILDSDTKSRSNSGTSRSSNITSSDSNYGSFVSEEENLKDCEVKEKKSLDQQVDQKRHISNLIQNDLARRPTTSRKNEIAAQLNLLANAMDNFSHGLTVGSAFLISSKSGFLSSFGILLHEIPHEFGDFAILLKSGKTIIECSLCQLSTSITSFIGGMTALFIGSGYQKEALAWLLPLSAGGFIFIALSTMKSLYEVEDENYKGTENYTNSNNAGQNLHQTKHKNEESEDIQSEEGKTSNDNSRKQDGRTTKSMNMKNYELKRRMMKREIKTNVDDEDEKEEKDNEEENIQKNLERIQKRQLEENFLKAINNKIIKICKSMKNTLILASISSDADKKRSNQQTSKTRKGKNTNEKEANIQGKYGVCQTEKDLNTNLYSKSEYLNVNLEYIPGKNRNFIKSEKEKVKISNASRDEKEIFIKNEKESLFSARAATASSEKGNLQILNFIFEACSILTGLIIMYCAMKWC